MASLPSWNSVYQLGEALRRILTASGGENQFPRYVRNRAEDPKWQGPYYYFNKHWRQDLVLVLEQIRLNVASNAPLSPAFGAAAQDYLTMEKGWSPYHVGRLSKLSVLAMLVGLSMIGALLAIAEDGYDGLPRLLRPGFFGVWLIIAARHQHYKTAAVFAALQARIESGYSLSEAMRKLSIFFPRDLVSLVAMAEKTGNLSEVLEGFSDDTITHWTAQRDLDKVLKYLGIGFLIQCSIFAFMVVKVLPVFEEILQELKLSITSRPDVPGLPVPLPSLVDLYEIANFVSVHRFHFAGAAWLIAFWIWIRPRRRRRQWSSRVETSLFFFMPGLRGLVARQNLASIAFMLGQLLRAGVPLEQALQTVADGDLHPLYQRWVVRVRASILQGNTLADSCADTRRLVPVPGSFISLVTMGENNVNLENALGHIADHYHGQVERRKRMLLGAILPFGVFIMGYITLSIEVALFQALIDLADSIVP